MVSSQRVDSYTNLHVLDELHEFGAFSQFEVVPHQESASLVRILIEVIDSIVDVFTECRRP